MNYKTVGEITGDFSVLVIGKTGNGKSTLGNALLGVKKFAVGRGMSYTTITAGYEYTNRNRSIKVIDTPDVTNCGLNEDQQQEEVAKWRNLVVTRPAAVLLVISCEVRFTAEEFAIYKKILKLWGNESLKDRLVVVFTFGDRLDGNIQAQINGASPELKEVLKDAEQAYFVFNKNDEQSRNEALDNVVKVLYERSGKKSSLPPMRPVERHTDSFSPRPVERHSGSFSPRPVGSYQYSTEMSDQTPIPKEAKGPLIPSKSAFPQWLIPALIALGLIAAIASVVLFVMNILIPAIICIVVAVALAALAIGMCCFRCKPDHRCLL